MEKLWRYFEKNKRNRKGGERILGKILVQIFYLKNRFEKAKKSKDLTRAWKITENN